MKIFMIAIILLFLIITWFTVDFLLGKKNHLQKYKAPTFPLRKSNATLYTDGPALFHDYFSELKAAKKHIHVAFYIVHDDEISRQFFQLLQQKAQEGVEVRLMLDRLGAKKVKKEMIEALRNAGGEFAFSQEIKPPFFFYSLQARNHRKITVIDGKIGYLGGFNVGKEYINLDKKLTPWRDYHLKLTGEGVQDLQSCFLIDWQREAKVQLSGESRFFPPLEKGRYEQRIFSTDGAELEEAFVKLIDEAKQSIRIGTPYFIPGKKAFCHLQKALKRGVKLEILVPAMSDHPLVHEASYHYLRKLIRLGAQVYQYKKGFYHAKVFIVDEKICDVGTANFDKRSFYINMEINCFTYDKSYIHKVLQVFKQDQADSTAASLNDLNSNTPWKITKELLARSISFFL